MLDDGSAPLCLPPGPAPNRADTLPPGTVDCHFHVIVEGAALTSPRSYTPRPAPLHDWLLLAEALGIERGVVVQPSVYGTDNTVLLAALAAAPDRLRGIVVIPANADARDLETMHRLGVRGIRVNLRNKGGITIEDGAALAQRIAPLGWHIQLQTGPDQFAQAEALATQTSIPLVIDHLGFMALDGAARTRRLPQLQRLLDGPAHVKISGCYRLATPPHYDGFAAVVETLAGTPPHRLLWGTDWPHTELFESMPDDADLLDAALAALPAQLLRQQVFVDNPHALYWS